MDQNNVMEKLIRVLEIRGADFNYLHPDGRKNYKVNEDNVIIFRELESKIIGTLIFDVSVMLLNAMEGQFVLPNTNVISTMLFDIDSIPKEDIDWGLNLRKLGGKQSWNHFGQNVFLMSRSKFHSLESNTEKLAYIAECHYKSLVSYCQYLNQDYSEIEKGIEILRNSDWYYPQYSKKWLNKKKTIQAWVQKLAGYDNEYFRLKILDLVNDKSSDRELGVKPNWHRIIEGKDLRVLSANNEFPVLWYEETGWKKGNIFYFQWGEEERYEFHGDSMQLFKNGELVS
jgi:hypothetical protein